MNIADARRAAVSGLRFKKWPIIMKIMAISAISIAFISGLNLFYFVPLIESRVVDARQNEIRNLVSMAHDIFDEYEADVRKSQVTRGDAQTRAAARIKQLRFGENNYFWINDSNYRMVMHPTRPDLDGLDQSGFKDPTGKFIFKEFVDASRRDGSGFIEYLWPKPGTTLPVKKIAFVKLYEPWGWVIGGGVYVDDIEKDLRQLRIILMTGTAIFAVVTLSVAWIIGINITRPLHEVMQGLEEVAEGQTGVTLAKRIEITATDEIGLLTSKFNELMESLHRLSVFKKVIEEDASLEQVYMRLHWVFTETIGIADCVIYEISASGGGMRQAYPVAIHDEELFCNPEILSDCELCKAKRTGHIIDSTTFPSICTMFQNPDGSRIHYCFPIIVGGGTTGVILFRAPRPASLEQARLTRARIGKAEHYINESLSVIETKRLMGNLRESSLRDPLTGLHNRRYLQEHMDNLVASMTRRKKSIGVIMCDIDYFKQVNDVHGHHAGDLVLKETATRIGKSIRETDVVIRFGGEEFLVILLDINGGESLEVAEKIRRNIEGTRFKVSDGTLEKTISLGISEFPDDSGTLWECIKFADVALYRAKDQGRNQSVRFIREMWSESQV
jgi:diguanylate cyclase (GGDEF)-like protein